MGQSLAPASILMRLSLGVWWLRISHTPQSPTTKERERLVSPAFSVKTQLMMASPKHLQIDRAAARESFKKALGGGGLTPPHEMKSGLIKETRGGEDDRKQRPKHPGSYAVLFPEVTHHIVEVS